MNKKTTIVVIGLVLSLSMINISAMVLPVEAAVSISIPGTPVVMNKIPKHDSIQKSSPVTSITMNQNPSGDPIYNLLIIAPAKYETVLQPLVDHKNDFCGIKTKLVTTKEIYAGDPFPVPPEARDKAEKVKYFIKNAYDDWGIKYVLLVGVDMPCFRHVPIRYCYNGDDWPEPCFISDLYYADIYDANGNFSSWDTDNDGIFGEWYVNESAEDYDIDLYPDVYVGRLPCLFKWQVKTVVNKIIKYETTTYGKSWFKNIIGASGDTYPDGTWYTADGTTSWSYDWNTTQYEDGVHTIYARSYDGKDYSKFDSVTVHVDNAVGEGGYINSFDISGQSYEGNGLPTVEITYPKEGDTVSGIVTVTGTASAPDGDVTLVELEIDGGHWHFPTPGYEGEVNVRKVLGNMSTIGFNPKYLLVSDGSFSGPKDIRRELNKGAGFMFLDGHSCPSTWVCKDENNTKVNGVDLFDLSAYLFSNKEKLPVCIWGGCHTFQFDVGPWKIFSDPDYKKHVTWVWECLGWAIVRLPRGGAIAAIGCTGLGLTKEDRDDCWRRNHSNIPTEGCSEYLDSQFFFRYINDNGSSSGSDILLGEMMGNTVSDYLDHFPINWSQCAMNDSADDAKSVQQWVLLGDPSLKIGGYENDDDSGFEVEAVVANAESNSVSGYVDVPVQLQASASGGTGSYVYEWQFEDGQLEYNTGNTAGCTWYLPGVYQATVKVTDTTDGDECTYDVFVSIASKPDAPLGPTSGETGVEYTFTALTTGSPSQDRVGYLFDWGDGTYSDPVGPYPSDKIAEAKYTWSEPGQYQVRVKSYLLDTENNLCEETGWSDPIVVDISGGAASQIQYLSRVLLHGLNN